MASKGKQANKKAGSNGAKSAKKLAAQASAKSPAITESKIVSPESTRPTGDPPVSAERVQESAPRRKSGQPRNSTVDLTDPHWEIIFNIGVVMALFYLIRRFVDNYDAHGYIVDLSLLLEQIGGRRMLIVIGISASSCTFSLLFWLLAAFYHASQALRPLCYVLYSACMFVLLTGPVFALRVLIPDYTPLHGISVTAQVVILVTKMHSYFFTQRKIAGPHLTRRTLADWVSFLFFPTLCFPVDGVFARTKRINWGIVFNMVLLASGCFFISYMLLVDEVFPNLALQFEVGYLKTLARIALPCACTFLFFFFGLFHAFFEATSELSMFADRHTYGAWWEVRNWGDFWKEWNYRVHQWLARHVFIGSQIDMKAPRGVAFFLSFIISGLLHEYVIFIAFRTLQFWILFTLVLQTLFMFLVRGCLGRAVGNALLWVGLHIGPSSIMIMINYSIHGQLHNFKLW